MVMKKIMIIDDDTTSLAIAKALLESEYEVATMQSGLQALGYLQDHQPPELILLDMTYSRRLKRSPSWRISLSSFFQAWRGWILKSRALRMAPRILFKSQSTRSF